MGTRQWNTHSVAGDQQVDDIVVELCDVIAHVQLGVSVSGARVLLSDVHPQHRAHDPDYESETTNTPQRMESEAMQLIK